MERTAVLQISESDRLDLQISNTVDQLLRGVRDAAMDVITEADRSGAFHQGSSVDATLDALMARILSQDKAIQFFRSGYEQGLRSGNRAKNKPPYLPEVHSDCFDLGYELGRLARERTDQLAVKDEDSAVKTPLIAASVG